MPTSSVASTSTGPDDVRQHLAHERAPGRGAEQPRVAQTYSESPTDRTRLRTTRAYDGQATITSARTALVSPRPSAAVTTIARMIAGNAKTRSASRMTAPSAHAAEVAGERAEDAADRRGEHDEEQPERQRDARAVDDAREHVAAELVRAEEWSADGGSNGTNVLLERVVRRDERRERGDEEPERRRWSRRRGRAAAAAPAGPAPARRRASRVGSGTTVVLT